jgi:hypothetical protein
MFYGEIMAVCSFSHTKHINTLCGQNAELLTVILSYYHSNYRIISLTNCKQYFIQHSQIVINSITTAVIIHNN